MKHTVRFHAGFDCINFECKFGEKDCTPGKGGSHGVHGMSIVFASTGNLGAVTFTLYTGILPVNIDNKKNNIFDYKSRIMPADLGYHSRKPLYEEQDVSQESCEYLDGDPCYYDGSGLNACGAMNTLLNGGDEALWKFLDQYYKATFEGGKYPEVVRYCKPVRGDKQ